MTESEMERLLRQRAFVSRAAQRLHTVADVDRSDSGGRGYIPDRRLDRMLSSRGYSVELDGAVADGGAGAVRRVERL